MTQKTTTTAAKSTTCNMSDSGSGTVVTVGVGARVTVVVRRNEWSVGKLEGRSIEPLLPSVARFDGVVPTVLEVSLAILAQLGTLVDCALYSGQVVTLRALVYLDCMARNSLLLGVSSVPLDNSAWQKYHPASPSFRCRTRSWLLWTRKLVTDTLLITHSHTCWCLTVFETVDYLMGPNTIQYWMPCELALEPHSSISGHC